MPVYNIFTQSIFAKMKHLTQRQKLLKVCALRSHEHATGPKTGFLTVAGKPLSKEHNFGTLIDQREPQIHQKP